MTEQINDGGPAFPVIGHPSGNGLGMTLRDYFAAKAMHGMASSDTHCVDGWAHSDIAIQAYKLADAMLKAREA